MHWFWWLPAIFLTVFLLLLFIPLTLCARYRYTDEQDHLEIQIIIWPGLKYYKNFYNLIHFPEKALSGQQKITRPAGEIPAKSRPVSSQEKKWRRLYKNTRPLLKLFLRYTNLRKMRWYAKIGLSDAAITGLAVGWLWCAAGIFFKILNHFIPSFCRPEIYIEPDFNKPSLAVLFELTASVRCGFLFLASLQTGVSFIKNRNIIKMRYNCS